MSLITFVVPVFNGADTIKQTILSLFNQSIKDFKIIVLDNGSWDNTLEILNSFDDERLIVKKYDHTKSLGCSLNRAFDLEIEGLFCICHADDLYNAKFAEKCIKEFELDNDVDVLFCNADLIDGTGKRISSLKNSVKNFINNLFPNFTGRSGIVRLFFFNSLIAPSACFRNSSSFKKIGFSENFTFYTDVYLWTRLLHQGARIKCMPYHGIQYRVHDKQLSFHAARWIKQLNELRSLQKTINHICGYDPVVKMALPLGIGFRWFFYLMRRILK